MRQLHGFLVSVLLLAAFADGVPQLSPDDVPATKQEGAVPSGTVIDGVLRIPAGDLTGSCLAFVDGKFSLQDTALDSAEGQLIDPNCVLEHRMA